MSLEAMAYLVRKISRAKWEPPDENPDGIQADAVTGDLRTEGNSLSFWKCESAEEEDLKKIILALGSASDRLEKIDIVWIEEGCVREGNLSSQATPGRTRVENLKDKHEDVINLDLNGICFLARQIKEAVRKENWKRFSRAQVREILSSAVKSEQLLIDSLPEKIKEELNKTLKL